MADFFYNIIIFPLAQIIELCFMLLERLFNPALALIGVSAVVSVGTLPLYMVAEKWQRLERDTQQRLAAKSRKIKAVFSGDEQYMILSTYFRQNHYHPIYALRSSFGLIIQIPFFIAAYSYLSHLEMLNGASFLFIADLGKPDGLLSMIGGGNLLPILMTVINCVSGAVYTKGFPLKDKIQLYGMAALFLVLLYNSPAGLVLYWTMNNVFSLIKNILQKTKYPLRIAFIALCTVALVIDIYVLFFFHSGYLANRVLVAVCCSSVFFLPLLVRLGAVFQQELTRGDNAASYTQTFVCSCFVLFLLAGLAIPVALVASSVQEFSFIQTYTSPLPFIVATVAQAAGFFLFYPLCLYFLFSKNVQRALAAVITLLCFTAMFNTYIFSGSYGFLTTSLTFSNPAFKSSPMITAFQIVVFILLVSLTLYLLVCRWKKILFTAQYLMIISLLGFISINGIKVARDFSTFAENRLRQADSGVLTPVYHFSTEGKNVLVIMLDRAISGYVPYIFAEKPELSTSFSGFTYYPNCVSFGSHTLLGVPPLFGGYEYTPEKLSHDDGRSLVEKHNEAILLLPKIFSDKGFRATVTDPSWANYSWKPDLSIFEPYPEIHAKNIIGSYSGEWMKKHPETRVFEAARFLKKNLIRFSFFKFTPPFVRSFVYDDGKWLTKIGETESDVPLITLEEYIALDLLTELTSIDVTANGTFTLLINQLTHDPAFFEAPLYTPNDKVINRGSGPFSQENDYHVNIASFLLLAKWFDFMKVHHVYDNTRIIIVADHGANISGNFPSNIELSNGNNVKSYNPLLMVKDFNAHGELVTNHSFMTNADTPFLATEQIIENPVNPFTGVPLQAQKEPGVTISSSDLWEPGYHAKNYFKINPDEWFYVHDNIFDPANWKGVEK